MSALARGWKVRWPLLLFMQKRMKNNCRSATKTAWSAVWAEHLQISPRPGNEGQRGDIWSAGAMRCLINLSWNKVRGSAGSGPCPLAVIGLYVLWGKKRGRARVWGCVGVCVHVHFTASPHFVISRNLADHNLNECFCCRVARSNAFPSSSWASLIESY